MRAKWPQQQLGAATVDSVKMIHQMVLQLADHLVVIQSMPTDAVGAMLHSGAAYASAPRKGAQGSHLVAARARCALRDEGLRWSLPVWK